MNRVVVSGGVLANGQIVRGAGGMDILYDAAGQRAAMTRNATLTGDAQIWVQDGGGYHPPGYHPPVIPGDPENGHYETQERQFQGERRETYGWSADGALAAVATLESGYVDSGDGYGNVTSTGVTDRAAGASTFGYDAAGRQTRQIDRDEHNATIYDRTTGYTTGGRITGETVVQRNGADTLTSTVTNGYATGAGQGQIGTVTAQNYKLVGQNNQYQSTTTTTNSYDWRGGAARLIASATSGASSSTTGYTFNAANQLDQVTITDGRPRTVSFVNDAAGQALRRDETDTITNQGDPREYWYRFAGVEIGHIGNNTAYMPDYASSLDIRGQATSAAPFGQPDPRYTGAFARDIDAITSYDTGSAAGRYTVRAGDTLQTIALALWGDSSLWYKLASANGLGANSALSPGQTLNVPPGIVRSTYNAATLTPYDPSDTLGDVSPVAAQPQAKAKKNKCGAFGQILLIAIAVAVTIWALPAAPSVWQGAIAGVAGSVASQGVGLATGIQDKFSWKGVALAGIAGGVAAGLGAGGIFGNNGAFSGVGSKLAQGALQGVAGNVATQGIALATGLQSKFDFAGVAVAGVIGGVGAWASAHLPGAAQAATANFAGKAASFGNQIGSSMASALAGAGARSLLTGTDFGDNVLAVLPDVIGSTIGRVAGNRLNGGPKIAYADTGTDEKILGGSSGTSGSGGGGGGMGSPDDIVVTAKRRGSAVTNAEIAAYALRAANEDRQNASDNQAAARLPVLSTTTRNNPLNLGVIDKWEQDYDAYWKLNNQDGLQFDPIADQGVRQGFADWRKETIAAERLADAEVNKLLFVSLGAPALLAGGAALAPIAGAYAGATGTLAYYGTSFTVGGAAGGAFEYSKNRVLDLPDTPGGYAGSILGGGIGGTGLQVLGRGAPVVLNNIVTGGVLGAGGDFVGQEIDMGLGLRKTLDGKSILVSGGIGAAAGGATSLEVRITGVNVGRNNSLSVYNGLQTRISTGNIGQFNPRYGVLGGFGQGVRGVGQGAASSVYVGIYQDANR